MMSWMEQRPRNANEQLLEFAESGRLLELDQRDAVHASDKAATVFAMVLSAAATGVGVTLLVIAVASESLWAAVVGCSVVAISLSLLLPSIRLVRLHTPDSSVAVKPGAVLPPELVREGNWIYRGGAWSRVEQIGRDGSGTTSALLSSGEVIDLGSPVTIAGGPFRPSVDPVSSLRR